MSKPSDRKPNKQEKEAAFNIAFEDTDCIVVRKVDFQKGLSTLLYNAWKHRNSESHLYALYNYIQTLQSLTLRHKTQAARLIAPWPQPLFGTLGPPQGEMNYPLPKATLPGNFYPDHARIMLFGSDEQGPSYSLQGQISIVIDSTEAKVLNTLKWNLEEGKRAAGKVIGAHIAQVCESSLAGLAHNPFWTSLYAFLLVGPYFSLFAWTTRPDEEHLESLPDLPEAPQPDMPSEKKEKLTTEWKNILKQRIDRIKKTPLPEVVYYNEPMFIFKRGQKWCEDVTLAPKYLHALSLPTSTLSNELACQPSWFEVNTRDKRVNIGSLLGQETLQKKVIDKLVGDEVATMNFDSKKPDPTLRGPKPPDSSDSQQSCFSETEPQVVDHNAGPHQMKTRASTRDAEDIDADLLE